LLGVIPGREEPDLAIVTGSDRGQETRELADESGHGLSIEQVCVVFESSADRVAGVRKTKSKIKLGRSTGERGWLSRPRGSRLQLAGTVSGRVVEHDHDLKQWIVT